MESTGHPHGHQVAFPVIGESMLDRAHFAEESASSYAYALSQRPRDWIYHVSIVAGQATNNSVGAHIYPPLRLNALLRLLHCPCTYVLKPREFMGGHEPSPLHRADSVFAQQHPIEGHSHDLAMAVGIWANQHCHYLPNNVLYSGVLGGDNNGMNTTLEFTGSMDNKLKLALGIGEGHDTIQTLVEEWYNFNETETAAYLGPRRQRVTPGRGKLFVASAKGAQGALEKLRLLCTVHDFTIPAKVFANAVYQDSDQEFMQTIRPYIKKLEMGPELGRDRWLVFWPIGDLFDVLNLYSSRHTPTSNNLPDITAHFIATPDKPHLRPRDEQDWRHRKKVLNEYLELQQQNTSSDRVFFEKMLRTLREEINRDSLDAKVFASSVGLLSSDGNLVYIKARDATEDARKRGFTQEKLYPYYPAYISPTKWATNTKEIKVVEKVTAAIRKDYSKEISQEFIGKSMVLRTRSKQQECFLSAIKASITFPIIINRGNGDEVRGVADFLYDNCLSKASANNRLFGLIQSVINNHVKRARAFSEVRKRLTTRQNYTTVVENEATSQYSDWDRMKNRRAHLANDANRLAEKVSRKTGAYRAAARIIAPDGTLVVVGHFGDFDEKWLKQHRDICNVTNCASFAIGKKRDQHLSDTANPLNDFDEIVPYEPVGPEMAAAHSSVLLRIGEHIFGVLSVDFRETGSIDNYTKLELAALAREYSCYFPKTIGPGLFLNRMDGLARIPDLQGFLECAANMVEAEIAVLFERDVNSGGYSPVYFHGIDNHFEVQWRMHCCPPNDNMGFLGWIVRHRAALRVTDVRDDDELFGICPEDPPVWESMDLLDDFYNRDGVSYLGVPIVVGNEVSAVLSFLNLHSKGEVAGFSPYDERSALAAAKLLGDIRYQKLHKRRYISLVNWPRKMWSILTSSHPLEQVKVDVKCTNYRDRESKFCSLVSQALKAGVGLCSCGIRLIDEMNTIHGEKIPALRRTWWHDSEWEKRTPAYRWGDSPALRVFRTGLILDEVDMNQSPEFTELEPYIRENYGHTLLAPFRGLHSPIGTIYIARKHPRERFSDADKHFFRALIRLIGPIFAQLERDALQGFELELYRMSSETCRSDAIQTCILTRATEILGIAWACLSTRSNTITVGGDAQKLTFVMDSRPTLGEIEEKLDSRNTRILNDLDPPESKTFLAEYLRHVPHSPDNWSEGERALVPIVANDKKLVAVLLLVAPPRVTLSSRKVNALSPMLNRLAHVLFPEGRN